MTRIKSTVTSRSELLLRLGKAMHRAYSRARTPAMDELSEIELTMAQVRVLFLLRRGPARMGEIAGTFDIAMSAATGLIDRLVAKHLVERENDPDDRRVVVCRLSDHGRTEIDRFWKVSEQKVVALADPLNDEQLARVVDAMELLAGSGSLDDDGCGHPEN